MKKDVRDILLDDDIFPLGSFEATQVSSIKNGHPESYPNIVLLKTLSCLDQLRLEAVRHIEIIGKKYVKDRIGNLNPDLGIEGVKQVLTAVGFTKETYQSYSLRKLGTNQLEDFVLPITRKLFEDLNFSCFRMQYAVAAPGWRTRFHIDHRNFNTHGFRGMVPIDSPAYLSYLENKTEIVYELLPGNMYFVNIAKLHRGFNPQVTERTNLLFQMASDELVVQGTSLPPLNDDLCIQRFQNYLSTEIMEIWR